jgi:hypothetical protein
MGLDFGHCSGTFDVAAGTITNALWSGTSGRFTLSFGTPSGIGQLSISFVNGGGAVGGPFTYHDVNAAPGPIPGAGLLSYVALGFLGLGSEGWKRYPYRSALA